MAGTLTPEQVARAGGEAARPPIRVYAGLGHTPSAEHRAELAAEELERLGGLRRRRIVVASPTGRGYVNPVAIEAEEHLAEGDVATVVVQYANRRSYRARSRVPVGARSHRRLLAALAERIGRLAYADRPEVVVYAESLGAWASLSGLAGPHDLAGLGVERGLWVGVPHEGRPHQARVLPAHPGAATTLAVGATAELTTLPAERRAKLRYCVLTRPDDPVALFEGVPVLWRAPRGPFPAPPWRPGLSFGRAVLEIHRATDFPAGRLGTTGHDYRGELARAIAAAFGHVVGDDRLDAIEAALLEAERERARAQGVASA